MNPQTRSLLAGLLGTAASALADPAEPVEIFAVAADPITGVEALRAAGHPVQVYDLDAPAALDADLSRDLPADPLAARAQVQNRLAGADRTALVRRAQVAYASALRALDYGLERIPAVVFDRRAVVYGEWDLVEALARYRQWRAPAPFSVPAETPGGSR